MQNTTDLMEQLSGYRILTNILKSFEIIGNAYNIINGS